MKPRRFFLLMAMIVLLELSAIAQNTATSEGNVAFPNLTMQRQGLHLFSYSAPEGQGFVLPPNAAGESSSRKHADSQAPRNPQAVGVQSANTTVCQEPARLFSPRDYTGPLNRFAARFSRKPEMTTVPKHKAGQNVCSLDVGEKFHLFYKTTVDPVTFMGAAAAAGYSQWQNDDEEWGQGAEGYGKRYAAAFGDRATRNFFRKFFYPSIFQQDPRYFRKGEGGAGGRIERAIGHTFVTRTDSGGKFANISLWAAIASTVAVENLYHPDRDRGFGAGAKRFGIDVGKSMGWDVLREFWPEAVRKLHLPFRERSVVPSSATTNP